MINLEKEFEEYKGRYQSIFSMMYPARGSGGFTERNQTCNFCTAYLTINPSSTVWYEFPFGKGKHYDAVIVDEGNKRILVVEAKRITNGNVDAKKKSINEDIDRIQKAASDWEDRFQAIVDADVCDFYGVILADVWKEKDNTEELGDTLDSILDKTADYQSLNLNLPSGTRMLVNRFDGFSAPQGWERLPADWSKEKIADKVAAIKDTYRQFLAVWGMPKAPRRSLSKK